VNGTFALARSSTPRATLPAPWVSEPQWTAGAAAPVLAGFLARPRSTPPRRSARATRRRRGVIWRRRWRGSIGAERHQDDETSGARRTVEAISLPSGNLTGSFAKSWAFRPVLRGPGARLRRKINMLRSIRCSAGNSGIFAAEQGNFAPISEFVRGSPRPLCPSGRFIIDVADRDGAVPAIERTNNSHLILRSRPKVGVSKDGRPAMTRGHPSRRAHRNRLLPIATLYRCQSRASPTLVRAPQDEGDKFFAHSHHRDPPSMGRACASPDTPSLVDAALPAACAFCSFSWFSPSLRRNETRRAASM
jgi:hypothetical protein